MNQKTRPANVCGCIETYPQLVPGMVAHAPECPLWLAAEKAKADAYEAAALICEEMSYPPEGYDSHRSKEDEWAAIKLEDAAKAIRERKAKVCHVTHAAIDGHGGKS